MRIVHHDPLLADTTCVRPFELSSQRHAHTPSSTSTPDVFSLSGLLLARPTSHSFLPLYPPPAHFRSLEAAVFPTTLLFLLFQSRPFETCSCQALLSLREVERGEAGCGRTGLVGFGCYFWCVANTIHSLVLISDLVLQ